ncbi:hypothetical protein ABZ883_14540 [Streptomyces sp. NPDC046977]|uniref:hypothetical protein n=1 Tax=Streptomyces sp. NPDC046977 TaxID=3154703 RepID=UPI00340B4C9B
MPDEDDLAERTEAWFTTIPGHHMADGRACIIAEEPGRAFVGVREGLISKKLCAELNALYASMLNDGGLVRHWGVDAGEHPDRKGRLIARYVIDHDGALPDGLIVAPVIKEGFILTLLHPRHIEQPAVDEINDYLDRVFNQQGLWEQRWTGRNGR